MRVGVVFPQTEIEGDVGAVRAFATRVEELGFAHILAYDHVIGADPAVHTGWSGPYDVRSTFFEPLVLFGFLAAIVSVELASGILILPQRQTVLVAKQAAVVDILSGGRLRLGVGIGWNRVEYDSLGKSFVDRGRRFDDQIALLRRLWTEDSLEHDDGHDTVPGAGIAPLPVQRPIPVWIGGMAPTALRRAGRIADGWLPVVPPGPPLEEARAIVAAAAVEAGRDPGRLGLEGRVNWDSAGADGVAAEVARWREAGATHVSINTMRVGLRGADEHLRVFEQIAAVL
jgi:probable F420-dependent oxidoreductase